MIEEEGSWREEGMMYNPSTIKNQQTETQSPTQL